jgi:hypothetical protein
VNSKDIIFGELRAKSNVIANDEMKRKITKENPLSIKIRSLHGSLKK